MGCLPKNPHAKFNNSQIGTHSKPLQINSKLMQNSMLVMVAEVEDAVVVELVELVEVMADRSHVKQSW